MKIAQMSMGSEVIIETPSEADEPNFYKTTSLFGMNGGLLVKVPASGKQIEAPDLARVTIHNKKDDRTYIFEDAALKPMNTDYGMVYMANSDSDPQPICRRKAERYDIMCLGNLTYHEYNGNVVIYDMSMRGVAVITGIPIGAVGDKVIIRFREGRSFHSYYIEAEIVRFFEVAGKAAIGCKVPAMPYDIMQLLEKKKREGKAKK